MRLAPISGVGDFLIKEMNLLVFVLLFVVSVALCSQCTVKSMSIEEINADEMIFYDFDNDPDHEIIHSSSARDAGFMVPPPPGNGRERIKSRKRADSISFTASDVDNFGAKELFCRPEYFETMLQDGRADSDETVSECWEDFIMDYDDLYGTRSNSSEGSGSGSAHCDEIQNCPSTELRKSFVQLGRVRSKSFIRRERHISKLSSHSEDQADETLV